MSNGQPFARNMRSSDTANLRTSRTLREKVLPRKTLQKPASNAETKQRPNPNQAARQGTKQETPAGQVDGGITESNTKQRDKESPKNQNGDSVATTLRRSEGVAAPSFSPGTLVEQGFDLLQLSLEHALDVLSLAIKLGGHLGLQR